MMTPEAAPAGSGRPRLLYPAGNIPSRWAHTFQMMRMADAFAGLCSRVEVLTERGRIRCFKPTADVHDWYGVSRRTQVVKLPLHLCQREEFFTHFGTERFYKAALRYAQAVRPDVVYTRNPHFARSVVGSGLPAILEIHDTTEDPAGAETVTALSRESRLLAIVTITDFVRDYHVLRGAARDKFFVWPDAVDLNSFDDLPSREHARRALRLPPGEPIALYCGHLYDFKGIPTILESARLLPGTRFILVGGWPGDIDRIGAAARHLPNVHLAGFVAQSHLPRYFAAADALLLPNSLKHEQALKTSPLKLFEYMAARRPIVASDIPALNGMLRHREHAWIVRPDSGPALAEGIEAVLADRSMAERLAGKAREKVVNFTWEKRARAILTSAGLIAPSGNEALPPA